MSTKKKSAKSWKNVFGIVKNDRLVSFNVYRDDWLRGDSGKSMLLNSDGERCCIGFMAAACGVEDRTLLGKNAIHMLPQKEQDRCISREDIIAILGLDVISAQKRHHDAFVDAYGINDYGPIDSIREHRIASWFKDTFDVKVNFIDGPTPKDDR